MSSVSNPPSEKASSYAVHQEVALSSGENVNNQAMAHEDGEEDFKVGIGVVLAFIVSLSTLRGTEHPADHWNVCSLVVSASFPTSSSWLEYQQ